MRAFCTTIVILCFALLATPNKSYAQDLTPMTWATHKLGFGIPSDFTITENNNTDFSANNKYVAFHLHPWQDALVTEENLGEMALSEVMDMGYTEITEFERLDLNGLIGYSTTGIRNDIFCKVGFFMNPKNSSNFVAVICYEEGWSDIADMLFSSIYGD